MILNAERRQRPVFEAFNRVVVQIDVRDVDIVEVETFRVDRETVILRRDLHLLSLDVEYGMISSVMPEFQLERPAAKREPHDLMAEADSKDRFLAEQRTNIPDSVFEWLGIAGTIREKHTVGLQRQYVLRRCGCGNDGNLRAAPREISQNVRLDSEVVSNDVKRAGLDVR